MVLLDRSRASLRLLLVAVAVMLFLPQLPRHAFGAPTVPIGEEEQVDPRTWPEIPIPPQPKEGAPNQQRDNFPALNKRWLMQVGAGWQHNASPQKAFFTDMVQLNLTIGKPVGEHLVPFVSGELGFGGLQDPLEQMTGQGRATALGGVVGLLGAVDFSQRHRVYASLAGGYFLRSMLWAEVYRDPETGVSNSGETITLGDWGLALRAGFLFQLPHGTKARFMDLGLGLQLSPADPLEFGEGAGTLTGSENDVWLTITLRFWDTL